MAPVLVILQKHQFGTLDAARGPSTPSFDYLVGDGEKLRRNFEAQCLRGLEIDDQLELRGLRYGQVGWLLALEDASDITAHQMVGLGQIGAVANEAAGRSKIAPAIDCRNSVPVRRSDERLAPGAEYRIGGDYKRSIAHLSQRGERRLKLGVAPHMQDTNLVS
jgi:hypothetical protein